MKVHKITGRGTGIREAPYIEQSWAGDAYRERQQERLQKVPKNLTVHIGRGVRTIKAGNIPVPAPRPSTEGLTRITNRGTGSRKSTYKGSQNQQPPSDIVHEKLDSVNY